MNKSICAISSLVTKNSGLIKSSLQKPQEDLSVGVQILGCSIIIATIALMLTLLASFVAQFGAISSADQFGQDILKPLYWSLLSNLRFWISPLVLVAIPILMALTLAFPAMRSQAVFSRGLLQDMTWSLMRTAITALFLTAYSALLIEVFQRYSHWTVFQPSLEWPLFWRVLAAYIASDFLFWLRHVAMHKVPTLWFFHAIHHSQQQLNPFTIDRVHPVEFLITLNICVIPLYMVTASLDVVVGYYLIRRTHDAFVHSNIRTNLGPLKYIFVTPQSHRIHHSCHTRHYDTNFGAILSIWDFIFRTQHRKYDEYPETGISDTRFPSEGSGKSVVTTLVKQVLYPFRAIAILRQNKGQLSFYGCSEHPSNRLTDGG